MWYPPIILALKSQKHMEEEHEFDSSLGESNTLSEKKNGGKQGRSIQVLKEMFRFLESSPNSR